MSIDMASANSASVRMLPFSLASLGLIDLVSQIVAVVS